MHYCIHAYTKEFPTDDVIERILSPYNEVDYYKADENTPRPLFLWDWWQLGGRYGGRLKLIATKETHSRYEWVFRARERRAGRLYRSDLLEKCARGTQDPYNRYQKNEEEVFPYLGILGGTIRIDGGWLPDIENRGEIADDCWGIVTDDGTAIVRDVWNGEKFEETPDFDARARLVMERCENDHYLTVIDIHS